MTWNRDRADAQAAETRATGRIVLPGVRDRPGRHGYVSAGSRETVRDISAARSFLDRARIRLAGDPA